MEDVRKSGRVFSPYLPGHPGRKVLHNDPVLGPDGSAVLLHPAGAAAPAALAAAARAAGMLNNDPERETKREEGEMKRSLPLSVSKHRPQK